MNYKNAILSLILVLLLVARAWGSATVPPFVLGSPPLAVIQNSVAGVCIANNNSVTTITLTAASGTLVDPPVWLDADFAECMRFEGTHWNRATDVGIPSPAAVADVADAHAQMASDLAGENSALKTTNAQAQRIDNETNKIVAIGQATTAELGTTFAAAPNLGCVGSDANGLADVACNPLAFDPYPTRQLAIVAAGTTASGCTQLTAELSVVSGGGGGGVCLPPAIDGVPATIVSLANQAITVYPNRGDTISGGVAGAGVPLLGNWAETLRPTTHTGWQIVSNRVPNVPVSASLLGTNANGAWSPVGMGAGCSIASGALTCTGTATLPNSGPGTTPVGDASHTVTIKPDAQGRIATLTPNLITPAGLGITFGTDIGDVPQLSAWNGGAYPGLPLNSRLIVGRSAPGPNDYADLQMNRTTTFDSSAGSGLTNGINGLLTLDGTYGPYDASQEWNIKSNANTDGISGGVAVGGDFQATRTTVAGVNGTDAIWGLVAGAFDQTDQPSLHTSAGTNSTELDLFANQADNGAGSTFSGIGKRHFSHMVFGRALLSDSTPAEFSNGINVSQQDSSAYLDSYLGFSAKTQVRDIVDARGAIPPTGVSNPVVAVAMYPGQVIDFDAPNTVVGVAGAPLYYSSTGNLLTYAPGGNTELTVDTSGNEVHGAGTGQVTDTLDGATSTRRWFAAETAGSLRWEFGAESDAETGGNTGSTFGIVPCTDAGSCGTAALTINRYYGNVAISNVLQVGTASANYLQVTGKAATVAPTIQTLGTDTNIDISLVPKGTGLVRAVAPPAADSSTAVPTTAWVAANTVPSGGRSAGKPSATTAAGTVATDTNGQRLCVSMGSGAWRCVPQFVLQSGAAVASAATTSEQLMTSVPLPPNLPGPNGTIVVTTQWMTTNDSDAKNLIVRYSNTSGIAGTAIMNATVTTTASSNLQAWIRNLNETNSQSTFPGSGAPFGNVAFASISTTVDTTATSYVNIDCALANASDSVTLVGYTIQVNQGS